MATRKRQQRYLEEGAGAGLVRVETLVPADGRDAMLKLASRLRRQARERASAPESGITPEELGRLINSDVAKWREVARASQRFGEFAQQSTRESSGRRFARYARSKKPC